MRDDDYVVPAAQYQRKSADVGHVGLGVIVVGLKKADSRRLDLASELEPFGRLGAGACVELDEKSVAVEPDAAFRVAERGQIADRASQGDELPVVGGLEGDGVGTRMEVFSSDSS